MFDYFFSSKKILFQSVHAIRFSFLSFALIISLTAKAQTDPQENLPEPSDSADSIDSNEAEVSPSAGPISVVVNPTGQREVPLAVAQVVLDNGKTSSFTQKITQALKTNLDLAAMFKLLDEKSLLLYEPKGIEIDFNKWSAVGAYGLIHGVIESRGVGKIILKLSLYDVAAQKALLIREYKIKANEYPAAVQQFVDKVLLELSGEEGAFHSLVTAACGRQGARRIYAFSPDGLIKMRISRTAGNHLSPSFSPDGSMVTFVAFRSGYPEVYVANVGGKKQKQITALQTTTITPAFTTDGRHLVFASSVGGDTELFMVNLSGKNKKRITRSRNIDLNPDLAANGQDLVFASERAGGLHLFKKPLLGGAANRLTFVGYQNDQPQFSPDGRKIAFSSRDKGAFDVFIMNADGSFIQRLTAAEGSNESPSFSADNRYIAFSSQRSSGSGIYIMNSDGENQTLIPNTQGCINPEWGPRRKLK